MERGLVSSQNEAILSLRLFGIGGREMVVDAVVDTGFTGTLAVPLDVVHFLDLAHRFDGPLKLADGSLKTYGIYSCIVE